MGYSIYLRNTDGELVQVPRSHAGTTQCVYAGDEAYIEALRQRFPDFDPSTLPAAPTEEPASMDITYNYSPLFQEAGLHPGDMAEEGITGEESIPRLEKAIEYLSLLNYKKRNQEFGKTIQDLIRTKLICSNYHKDQLRLVIEKMLKNPMQNTNGWCCTPDNCLSILKTMLSWAKLHPNARWVFSG